MKRLFVLGIALSLLSGCVHAVSRNVLKEVDREITFEALLEEPSAYQGRVVLLGGVIVNSVNKQEGTLLEVYQTSLDREGRPTDIDRSGGRFLALYQGFLDSEIYKQGRQVAIVGTVQGEKVQLLGEVEYRYPYLLVKEIHLWKEAEPVQHDPYAWGLRYDPWYRYPWGPWGFWGWYYPLRHPRHYPRHHHHGHH